ncbi:MAG TPA: histidine kinase [Nocardioides sp.]|nr:histidine kinase [Nocardioides sp.]
MIDPVGRFVEFTEHSTARKTAFISAVVVPAQIPLLIVAIVAFILSGKVDARWTTALLLAPIVLTACLGLVSWRLAERGIEGGWTYYPFVYGWIALPCIGLYQFGANDAVTVAAMILPALAGILLYGGVARGLGALAFLMTLYVGLQLAVVTHLIPYAPAVHERSVDVVATDPAGWIGRMAEQLLVVPVVFVLVILLNAAFVRARDQLDDAVGLIATLSDSADDPWSGLAAKVGSTLGAREAQVWEVTESGWAPVSVWPDRPDRPVGPDLPADRRLIEDAGGTVGALVIHRDADGFSAFEERLITELSGQIALLLRQRRHAAEIQAAARRIVTSADAARRRIERDLHDGAQQQMVALSIELSLLSQRCEDAGDGETAGLIEAARGQVLEATAELRELARGLHPAVLSRSGLTEAIRSLARRSPVPVELVVDCDGEIAKDVELTAYMFVSEGLTNVARYSGATCAEVRVVRAEDRLAVAVSDDGCGGADPVDGSGLRGMADRLAALGASLDITSPAGAGTTISTVLPCV